MYLVYPCGPYQCCLNFLITFKLLSNIRGRVVRINVMHQSMQISDLPNPGNAGSLAVKKQHWTINIDYEQPPHFSQGSSGRAHAKHVEITSCKKM